MPVPTVLQAVTTKTGAFNGSAASVAGGSTPFYWDLVVSSLTAAKTAIFALQLSTDPAPAAPFSTDVRTVGLFSSWGPKTGDAPSGMPPQHNYDLPLLRELISAAPVAAIAAPGTVTPSTLTTGGTLADTTYYYKVTALTAAGETTGSPEASQLTSGGGTSTVTLNWVAVAGALSYKIYRGTTTNLESVYLTSATNSITDTGTAGTAGTVPVANTTAGPAALALRVAVLSLDSAASVTYSSRFWQK